MQASQTGLAVQSWALNDPQSAQQVIGQIVMQVLPQILPQMLEMCLTNRAQKLEKKPASNAGRNPYVYFNKIMFKELKQRNPDMSFKEIHTKIVAQWNQMSDEQKN